MDCVAVCNFAHSSWYDTQKDIVVRDEAVVDSHGRRTWVHRLSQLRW